MTLISLVTLLYCLQVKVLPDFYIPSTHAFQDDEQEDAYHKQNCLELLLPGNNDFLQDLYLDQEAV